MLLNNFFKIFFTGRKNFFTRYSSQCMDIGLFNCYKTAPESSAKNKVDFGRFFRKGGGAMGRYDDAISKARAIRKRYFTDGCSPMEAFENIFKEKDIEIRYELHGESLQRLNKKWIITLPRNTSSERDVYTIAHEIGHIVLGHNLDEAGMIFRSGELTITERQANVFAAELLMPEDLFREVCKECDNNVYEVAFRFGVSPSAAGVRMSILGIA